VTHICQHVAERADALPDISRPTSNPRSCLASSGYRLVSSRGCYASVTPSFLLSPSALVHVRHHYITFAGMLSYRCGHQPMRTRPVTSTSSRAQGKTTRCGLHYQMIEDCPKSVDAHMMPPDVGHRQAINSANAPARFTPTPEVWAQDAASEAVAAAPTTTCPSPLTIRRGESRRRSSHFHMRPQTRGDGHGDLDGR